MCRSIAQNKIAGRLYWQNLLPIILYYVSHELFPILLLCNGMFADIKKGQIVQPVQKILPWPNKPHILF